MFLPSSITRMDWQNIDHGPGLPKDETQPLCLVLVMDKTTLTVLILLFFLVAFVSGCSSTSDEIWTGTDVLNTNYFNSGYQFIIYLHGKIIEDEGLNAIHPDYGRYEYNEILVYLASSGGQIISEIRPAGTDPIAYAEKGAVWINHLLDHGVPPQKIFVIGFSKGGAITIHLSDHLKNPGINYVLIGICSD